MCQDPIGPLNAHLSEGNEHMSWNETTIHAFSTIEVALASAILLAHPKLNALTNIMTDASDTTAVGAVLQ